MMAGHISAAAIGMYITTIKLHSAQSRRDELEVRLTEWHADYAELRAENEELRSELRYVEGREDALLEVIRRCRWS